MKTSTSASPSSIRVSPSNGKTLQAQGLSVQYSVGSEVVQAVDNVSFDIWRGKMVGLVGESGCGKTTVSKAILRLLSSNARIPKGQVLLDDEDLLALSDRLFRKLRWKKLSYIPQNALSALNPVYRVGAQIAEPLRIHAKLSRRDAQERVYASLERVHLDSLVARAYPHQLSGGMRQRILIAMALTLEPSLVIVDEPTTALDVLTQLEVLREFRRVRETTSSSFLYISHDLGVVKELCDEVLVMYAGRLVEHAPTASLFTAPLHPFTMGLLYAIPEARGGAQLVSIPGDPPDLRHPIQGCPFAPRCPFATRVCQEEAPPLKSLGNDHDHLVACHHAGNAAEFRMHAGTMSTWDAVNVRGEQDKSCA